VYSTATEASILAVQVFDQKKFKKKDQGFLGVINIRVGDVMPDLTPEANGTSPFISRLAFGLPCLPSCLDNALFLGLL
jgi:hypothetical protein